MDENNQPKLTVKYPKFKGGDATVKELKLKSNYGQFFSYLVTNACGGKGYKMQSCNNMHQILLFYYLSSIININQYVLFMLVDYVNEIYKTLMKTPRKELTLLQKELYSNVPEPMCNSFDNKEDKADAKTNYLERKNKETVFCPATCTGEKDMFLDPFNREQGNSSYCFL